MRRSAQSVGSSPANTSGLPRTAQYATPSCSPSSTAPSTGVAPSVGRVRSRALPPRSQLPASATSNPAVGVSVHSTGVRPSSSTTTSRAVGPARLLPGEVGAQRLVAEHLGAGEHRGCREPERHATPPSARSAGPITLASPTTTPVTAEGAKNRSAAAATSSGVTAESRAG